MGAGCHVNCTYRIVMMYLQLVKADLLFLYVSEKFAILKMIILNFEQVNNCTDTRTDLSVRLVFLHSLLSLSSFLTDYKKNRNKHRRIVFSDHKRAKNEHANVCNLF